MRRAALLLLLALAGCANDNPPPVELSARFTPPDSRWLTAYNDSTPPAKQGACVIRLLDVRDTRADAHSMGTVGARMIDETDSIAWMRSAMESLKRDRRISFAGSADARALDLRVEIVKAYMLDMPTTKATSIVVRIDFSGTGEPSQAVYRGTDTSMNWASESKETQSAFDRATAQLMASIDEDIVARCGPP